MKWLPVDMKNRNWLGDSIKDSVQKSGASRNEENDEQVGMEKIQRDSATPSEGTQAKEEENEDEEEGIGYCQVQHQLTKKQR